MRNFLSIIVFLSAVVLGLYGGWVWGDYNYFGKKTVGSGSHTQGGGTDARAHYNSMFRYTASANDSVLQVFAYMASSGANDTACFALYYEPGPAFLGARATAVCSIAATSGFPTFVWESTTVNWQLTSGSTYVLAIGEVHGSNPETVYMKDSSGTSGDMKIRAEIVGDNTLLADPFGSLNANSIDIITMYCQLNTLVEEAATGPPNARHGPEGAGQRHGPDGASVRHEP